MGGGPHTFDCAGPTTVVTTGRIVIDNDVILDGEGNLTVEANSHHNTFEIAPGVTAELHGFAVTHSPGVPSPSGSSEEATGILNRGTLTVTNTTVSGNHGIPFCDDRCGAPMGGGIYNDGVLTLTDSVVTQNDAQEGSGILGGTLTMTNSVVSGNTGYGIYSYATITITNSTVSGNGDDGVLVSGPGSSLTATNCTISGNGGFEIVFTSGVVSNSVIDGGCLAFVVFTSNGYNIESPGDTCGFDKATDQVDVTAAELNLGPLQDNSGPTETHALLPGRVAIDWVPDVDCVDADGLPLTTDQRGEPRPETGGTMCDVGAFEVQP